MLRMKKRKDDDLITVGLIRRLLVPDGMTTEVNYDAADLSEAAGADRIFDRPSDTQNTHGGRLTNSEPAMAPLGGAPGSAGSECLLISQAFERFCLEKRTRVLRATLNTPSSMTTDR